MSQDAEHLSTSQPKRVVTTNIWADCEIVKLYKMPCVICAAGNRFGLDCDWRARDGIQK